MRIPAATYRVQFNPLFSLRAVNKIAPYLAELGISDIYASPIFKARKGSGHGYDVVDPTKINPELGTLSDFKRVVADLKKRGIGWIQDIVPNHMAVDPNNPLLMDVLENGDSSRYAHFFDIDWDHPSPSMRKRLLAPFLGRFYGASLEDGEIVLKYSANGLSVTYFNLEFPLRIESYSRLLTYNLEALKIRLGEDHPDFIKFMGMLYILKTLPSGLASEERYGRIKFVKQTLWELHSRNQHIREFVDANVRTFNGLKGQAKSFNLLDDLLRRQLFRLSFWKVAAEEIDYRRFFNINELISLRMEHEDVFNHAHQLIFELIENGMVSGLRIDHVDGLYDPATYFQRLREKATELYIAVEKILGAEESLPDYWPVQGTTGYDFLNYVNGLFCRTENERAFTRIYASLTGFRSTYESLLRRTRRLIIEEEMAGDVDNLAHMVRKISTRDRHGSDITLYALRRALTEVLALFPVYRTYINQVVCSEADREYIRQTLDKAMADNASLIHELMFIRKFLLLDFPEYLADSEKRRWIDFAMKFQQHTGPLMAKGFEDTMLYVYNRLVSLNEVGGRPDRFGCSLAEFHNFNNKRMGSWPHSLSATSTHDTKRGEDVRARINVLSEIPEEWRKNVSNWVRRNRGKKRRVSGKNVPDKNDEYFLYQTLIGTWPFIEDEYSEFLIRMKQYIIKTVREAKVHTAWLRPDTEYEDAYVSFVEKVLTPSKTNAFLWEFRPFQKTVAHYGICNSLSQTLIKITSPGVPDFYQGTELWDLSLVDPDNRRPVDYDKRAAVLDEIRRKSDSDLIELIEELRSTKEDGRIKLFLIYRALNARKSNLEVFQHGSYLPLECRGDLSNHLVAFARVYRDMWAVTITPRFVTTLVRPGEFPLGRDVWQDSAIIMPDDSPSVWLDALTREEYSISGSLEVGDILRHFPAALLMGTTLSGTG